MCFLAFSDQYFHNFSFQSHRLLFSHASAEVRGENTPERKVASTGDRTHNHQVMSPTRSTLSHPVGAYSSWRCIHPVTNKPIFSRVPNTSLLKTLWEKEKLFITSNFSFSHSIVYAFGELSARFVEFEIVVSRLFQFRKSLNFCPFGKS